MYESNTVFTPKNDTVKGRQIAFAAAFLLPASKLLEVPSLLSRYAAGDLLLPALMQFIFQAGILWLLLFASSRSETPLFVRLQNVLGKGISVFYILYAAYFLFAALLPLLDFDKYIYAAFFDTEPTIFFFAFFFFLSAFICTKGIKAIGRSADLCLFLFLLPFLALIVMSLGETDFTHLLPLFGTNFGDTMSAFTRSTPHFSDVILLFPLLGNFRYKKGDTVKIMGGYALGAAFILLFLAVFFGIFSAIAPREHYAFSKIAQYFPALAVVGRIDLVFIYFLSVVLLFYTCLPLQYTTDFIARLFKTERRTWISVAVNAGLLLFTLFGNQYYNLLYKIIGGKLFPVFWLFADFLPLLCLFLPTGKEKNKRKIKKKEKKVA